MRSARDTLIRPLAIAACVGLLGAGAAGCSTTQDKAAALKVESERYLKEREERQKARKAAKAKKNRRHDHEGKNK